jgi:transcriptional regulator with PAS, ATPase and Fis domain
VKRRKISINPYILIPATFSGISVLILIVAFRLSAYYARSGGISDQQILGLAIVAAAFSFACSFVILRFILNPVTRFVKTARTLPALSHTPDADASGDLEQIEEMHRMLDRVTTVLSRIDAKQLFPGIVGQSRAMRAVFGQIMKVAPTDTTVLITGESGTGKELAAQAIYENSLRKDRPFIKINCVAIPEGLLESELFGHERGAFTGAIAQKKGKFELADGGTIFLDEIGDMPAATQAKLLRVLQEKEFDRVGGSQTISVDVRIIAATNKNLAGLVKTGIFREDLFYRLNVFNIHLPALRDRREDIPMLTDHFLGLSGKSAGFSSTAMELLLSVRWPGNVRELQNVVERAAIMAEEGIIEPGHLPAGLFGELPPAFASGTADETRPLDDQLAEMEKGMILEALNRAGGIQSRAAQTLGINQRSLWHRIKKYNIDVSTFKNPEK